MIIYALLGILGASNNNRTTNSFLKRMKKQRPDRDEIGFSSYLRGTKLKNTTL